LTRFRKIGSDLPVGLICRSPNAKIWFAMAANQQAAGWVEPFAKPITIQKVMGIALLNPSYGLAKVGQPNIS
jgi:hypothetical protein